jgi:UV DNA damage endonuclease
MHPGQYTVLNSPNPDVVSRAIDDLIYHLQLLEALGSGQSSKIILHLGGVYGDKESALKRLTLVYNSLDPSLKRRIIFENDDKAYNICDVLDISDKLGVPAVYDNLHCDVNPCESRPHSYWVDKAAQTWTEADGTPKIHYSQQAKGRPNGAHSQTIAAQQFANYINQIGTGSDIMLEVKDKNISAVKCINIMSGDKKALERDWQRYKYKMLELSPSDYKVAYDMISSVSPDSIAFYSIAEHAFEQAPTSNNILSAAKTVWQECFPMAESIENDKFLSIYKDFSGKKREVTQLKKYIRLAAQKYELYDLYNSFYLNLNT